MIEGNAGRTRVEQTQEGKALNKEIIRAMIENEAIDTADSSCKDEHVAGAWEIENDFDVVSEENNVQSNNWKHSTATTAQALVVLDLVQALARSMRNENEGALKIRVDCKVVWAMLCNASR